MDKLNMTFVSEEVLGHEKLQRIPTKVDELVEYVNDMSNEVFPLVASYATKSNSTFEVGTSVTPSATLNISRKGEDVSSSASLTVTKKAGDSDTSINVNSNHKAWSATAKSSGYITINTKVTQGGQTVDLGNLTWTWTNYRYMGEVSSVPSDYAVAIKNLNKKELSTVATLGSTALGANKYYLFAVKGSVTLTCRHAATDGLIDGCVTGTATIGQENDYTITNTYSYILVPKSTSSWNFKITNS